MVTSRAEALIVLLICLVVAGGAFIVGTNPGGRHSPLGQCLSLAPPTEGGPYLENSAVSARPHLLPLGLDCWWNSPDDALGAQLITHEQWPATIVLVLAGVGAAGAVIGAARDS